MSKLLVLKEQTVEKKKSYDYIRENSQSVALNNGKNCLVRL